MRELGDQILEVESFVTDSYAKELEKNRAHERVLMKEEVKTSKISPPKPQPKVV